MPRKAKYGYDHGFGSEENASLVHYCALQQKEHVVVYYIEAGWCIMFRRKLKKLFMVNDANPRTRMFLKSKTEIRQERARHLQYYYFVIHPFSIFRAYWEIFIMVVIIISMITTPIDLISSYLVVPLKFLRLSLDIMCLGDCLINFSTGYYNEDTKQIILDRRLISKNYVTGHFICDFVASTPAYMLPYFYSTQAKTECIVRLLFFIKFLRIFTLITYMQRCREFRMWSYKKFKILRTTLTFSCIVCVATCIIYIINMTIVEGWLHPTSAAENVFRLLYSCFQGVCILFLATHGDTEHGGHQHESFANFGKAAGIQMGAILYIYMLASLMQIVSRFRNSRTKYEELVAEVKEYVRFKDLPGRMRDRLLIYLDYKYQKHFYDEMDVMETISPQLKQEILIATCTEFLERVEFFKDLPSSLLLNLVKSLKTVVYLPNDIVVHVGYEADAMYFIIFGTVAVFASQGTEVCHLSDGHHFGEVALLAHEKRVVTVVALCPCEIMRLSKSDFQEIMAAYPEYLRGMRKVARRRFHEMKKLVSPSAFDLSSDTSSANRRTTMAPFYD